MGLGIATRCRGVVARVVPLAMPLSAMFAFTATPLMVEAATPSPTPNCTVNLLGACVDVLPGVLGPASTQAAATTSAPSTTQSSTTSSSSSAPSTHTSTSSSTSSAQAIQTSTTSTSTATAGAAGQAGTCIQTVLSVCAGDGSVVSVGGVGQLLTLPTQCLPLSLLCTCPDSASVGGSCAAPTPPPATPTATATAPSTSAPRPTPTPGATPGPIPGDGAGGNGQLGTGFFTPSLPKPPPTGSVTSPLVTTSQVLPAIPGLQLGSPLVLWPLFIVLDTLAVAALVWLGRRSWTAAQPS